MGTTGSFPPKQTLNPNTAHRVAEDVGSNLEPGGPLVLPAQKRSPRSSCLGLSPGSFLTNPKTETLSPCWAASPWKSVFWYSEGAFLVQFCPLACVIPLGTTEKSLTLSSFKPPFCYLYMRSPLLLLFCSLKSLNSLSSYERCFTPSMFSGHSLHSLQ